MHFSPYPFWLILSPKLQFNSSFNSISKSHPGELHLRLHTHPWRGANNITEGALPWGHYKLTLFAGSCAISSAPDSLMTALLHWVHKYCPISSLRDGCASIHLGRTGRHPALITFSWWRLSASQHLTRLGSRLSLLTMFVRAEAGIQLWTVNALKQ